MNLGFCAQLPPKCADGCFDAVDCLRTMYCMQQGIGDCAQDADCRLPDSCGSKCLPYAPCFLCENSCTFDGDHECDDGDEGALYSACPPGSDCADCGVRVALGLPPPPPAPPPPSAQPDTGFLPCDWAPSTCNTCRAHVKCLQHLYCTLARSDVCSGLSSASASCVDAPRYCIVQCALFAHCFLCTDSCDFSGDGDCDDGGAGSEFNSCPPGSDCADCGARGGSFLKWDEPQPWPSPSPLPAESPSPPPSPHSPPLSSPPPPPHLPPYAPASPPPSTPSTALPSGTDWGGGWTVAIVVIFLLTAAGMGAWCYARRRSMRSPLIGHSSQASGPIEFAATFQRQG